MTRDATNSQPVNDLNLTDLHGRFKAIGTSALTSSAKYIATLMLATGVRSPLELRTISGLAKTTVYRVLSEIYESSIAEIFAAIPMSPDSPAIPSHGTVSIPASPADGKDNEITVPPVPLVGLSEPEPSCARDITTRANNELPSEVVILEKIPPSPQKPTFGRTQALEAFHAYNDTALRCGLAQASRMTPDRERKIVARLKEFGMAGWHRCLANIEKSPFLKGEGGDGKWRASLDFMLQASSFAKLHDGAYSAPEKVQKPAAPSRSRFLDDDSWKERVAQDMIDRGLASVIN